MGRDKRYRGYRSFQYLEEGIDYPSFELATEIERVPPYRLPLSDAQEERAERIAREQILVSLHDHLGRFPEPISDTPAYVREGRQATAFEGLSHCHWDCIFENFMDGVCQIHSKRGWKWTEVLHDLGVATSRRLPYTDFIQLVIMIVGVVAALPRRCCTALG